MKTKIFTSLILGILLLSFQLSRAQVLYNGDFESSTVIYPYCCETPPFNNWNSFKNIGTDANAIVVDGICNYQITNAGVEAWEVQLEQLGFALQPGHTYRLQYDVKADVDRWYGLYLGEYYGNWTTYLGWENYWQYATTGWQTMTFDFNFTCNFAINKLSFELGGFNTSMYFDNISIVDQGEYTPSVGILGTSLPGGWDTDVNMLTTDDVNYTLSNFLLMSGAVKFRQDDLWCVNWGDYTFPTGTGYQDGPNIPLLSYGYYDITFNRVTGAYSFTCVNSCPDEIGIIGSAVPPNFEAGPDVNMSTNDGVNYFLNSYKFSDGEAKFRKDDSWTTNWGNTTFPSGIATPDGPPISVKEGVYNVTFNMGSGEYNFGIPTIGIIGSSLSGWIDDIDMQSTDGILYTLTDYPFLEGEVKFRANNSWDVNWGGATFPTGIASFYGPNIPIPCACTYDVTFNVLTGEYNFVLDDTEPPAITDISSSLTSLWPPNHQMIPVTINYSASDNCCGTVTNQLSVSSNEPVNGLGDGDMTPDWVIGDEHNIMLRAERSGKGTGRVYTINILSTDASGNASSQVVTVAVPHDRKDLKVMDVSNEVGKEKITKIHASTAKGQFKVQAWPNPATQKFNLQVQSLSSEKIEVYISDITGRRISKLITKSTQSIFFGDDLQPGMYIVEIRQGANSRIMKVVKQ